MHRSPAFCGLSATKKIESRLLFSTIQLVFHFLWDYHEGRGGVRTLLRLTETGAQPSAAYFLDSVGFYTTLTVENYKDIILFAWFGKHVL